MSFAKLYLKWEDRKKKLYSTDQPLSNYKFILLIFTNCISISVFVIKNNRTSHDTFLA